MIYRKLIVSDQSNEVSCHNKDFSLCLVGLGCSRPGVKEKNKSGKIGVWKRLAVAGYHAVVCDAFICFILRKNTHLAYAKSVDPDQTPRLRRLIWVCSICLYPILRALGIHGLITQA